jgi:hypothetical protein
VIKLRFCDLATAETKDKIWERVKHDDASKKPHQNVLLVVIIKA